MAGAVNAVSRGYHQPLWGRTDAPLRRSLVGSGAVGLAVLVFILVAPKLPPRPVTFEQVPDRIAKLILEKPRPAAPARVETARVAEPAPAAAAPAKPATTASAPAPAPQPVASAKPAPSRRAEPAPLAPDRGVRGREQATTEVAANLKQVTGSLDRALDDLAQALPKAGQTTAPTAGRGPGGRSRQVRAARSGDEVGGVEGRAQLAAVDLGGSGLGGGSVSIAAVTDLDGTGGGGNGTGTGGGDGAGVGGAGTGGASGDEARSNASLLAVVRRYAAGIQFCYENELKRQPGLHGKLVFSLTIDAAGRVTDVSVVEDGLKAPTVAACALAQIRDWRFPVVERGLTTFSAPFVFTPPQ